MWTSDAVNKTTQLEVCNTLIYISILPENVGSRNTFEIPSVDDGGRTGFFLLSTGQHQIQFSLYPIRWPTA